MRHRPQTRDVLDAAGLTPPRRGGIYGPDFTREGDVLYPQTERAQDFIDASDEQELDFSGGLVWSENLDDAIKDAGLSVEVEGE